MGTLLKMFENLFNLSNFNMLIKPSFTYKKIKTEEDMIEERKKLKLKSTVYCGNGDKNELYKLRLEQMIKTAQEDEIRAEKLKK